MRRLRASRVLPLCLSALLFSLLSPACNQGSEVSRLIGARCQGHDECDGVCLVGAAYPDGFCSLNCNQDRDCPGASRCADVDQGVCLFGCIEAADCEFLGPGWSCFEMSGRDGGEPVRACAGQGPDGAGSAVNDVDGGS